MKEASSFTDQFAKNNLGIIYKHEFDQIEGRSSNAIVYFEEAIRQKKKKKKRHFIDVQFGAHLLI